MAYENNDSKFIAVLNGKIELAPLLNAMAHAVIGLSAKGEIEAMKFLPYEDAHETLHSAISLFPVIVLKAKNSNQLRTLYKSAQEEGIVCNAFVQEMLAASADKQLQQTRSKPESELTFWVVTMFGSADQINGMTRKFSLFKSNNGGVGHDET